MLCFERQRTTGPLQVPEVGGSITEQRFIMASQNFPSAERVLFSFNGISMINIHVLDDFSQKIMLVLAKFDFTVVIS